MVGINPLEKKWEEQGLFLRDYQSEGVSTMDKWYRAGHGGINGDEMGLGKTCQAIVEMLRLKQEGKGPFLVICPLSVCDHWLSEVTRFSCGTLEPIPYFGYESERAEVLKKLKKLQRNTVFITPFHIFRVSSTVLSNLQEKSKLKFEVIVVDEAQAIKNIDSMLAESLKPYRSQAWFLLMTGTPIQNNLSELYALLTFVDPVRFADNITARKDFIARYTKDANIPELRNILSKYLIRRTKDVVCKELPSIDQVIIYHNLSEIQKKLYLNIIAKNYDDFLTATNMQYRSLNNLQVQLRKCVAHPYLFKGVEPEPFEEGEHLVEASGKLQVLDRLLRYLKERKHRCLIFSQFVIVLDIVQDFMNLRGYNYERIDGSVRAEERYTSINEFQGAAKKKHLKDEDNPWCFLLSTRSGGVGLNLTGADTVIFLDADWNPQNDIQAMARCHRIGQDKPVRVIRLIGRYTVEQHMHAHIRDKLKFTDKIMGNEEMKLSAFDMMAMVKQSLGTLKEQTNESCKLSDEDLESVIGQTGRTGKWLPMKEEKENQVPAALRLDPDEVDKRDTDYNDYRVFEGHQYRISAKDEAAFEELRLLKITNAKRSRRPVVMTEGASVDSKEMLDRMKKTEQERAAAAEKHKKAAEEKRMALWTANGYVSNKLPLPPLGDHQNDEMNEIEEGSGLFYVHGDLTKPQRSDDDRTTLSLILHCVDNSGKFGNGGIFSALRAKDPAIAERYELISRMGDMKMGDCHLVEDINELREVADGDDQQPSMSSDRKEHVVLFVALSSKRRSELRPSLLEQCFTRIGEYARNNNASVHMARIGYGTSLSWYAVERLLKKCITNHGVPTYIYYFVRRRPQAPRSPEAQDGSSKRKNSSPRIPKKRAKIASEYENDSDEEEEEENEEDDSSSASSSASEHDWSEGDEESSEDEISSPSEEEVDDEELSDLEIKRNPVKRRTVRKRTASSPKCSRNSMDRQSVDEETDNEQIDEKVAVASESDTDGYHTPEHLQLFTDLVISVYGVKETDDELIDLIVKNGGYIVNEVRELIDATHAIIPKEIVEDSSQFHKFQALFNEDCIFIKDQWFKDCVEAGKRLDTMVYEVCK